MASLIALVALLLGYAVGRRWIVVAAPLALVAVLTSLSGAENLGDPCARSDRCGAGPVFGTFVVSLLLAAVLAALLAAGVALRRRRRR